MSLKSLCVLSKEPLEVCEANGVGAYNSAVLQMYFYITCHSKQSFSTKEWLGEI